MFTAFAEVEDALVSYLQQRDRSSSLQQAVAASQQVVSLATIAYESGVVEFQNVVDAERILTAQQDEMASSQGDVMSNLVRLYRALGGGWDPETP